MKTEFVLQWADSRVFNGWEDYRAFDTEDDLKDEIKKSTPYFKLNPQWKLRTIKRETTIREETIDFL